jgi:uncharacterized protein YciW
MAGVSEPLRAVLEFATKLTKAPEDISGDDISALRDAGWTEQTIEDAINAIALFNYVNRLVDAFGIEGSQAYFDHVGAALAAHGYAPLIHQGTKKSNGA